MEDEDNYKCLLQIGRAGKESQPAGGMKMWGEIKVTVYSWQSSGSYKLKLCLVFHVYFDLLCAFNVLKFSNHLLFKVGVSLVSGCVSCCVSSVCTVWAAWNAAACQTCMDYRRHLANLTIKTIRLAFWVNFFQMLQPAQSHFGTVYSKGTMYCSCTVGT